jgi:hypothetical protein
MTLLVDDSGLFWDMWDLTSKWLLYSAKIQAATIMNKKAVAMVRGDGFTHLLAYPVR